MDEKPKNSPYISIIINEAQLLLAEKRTSLAVISTGIAVLALPMSVISLPITTSRYYDIFHFLHFLISLEVLNTILTALGSYLIIKSTLKMRKYDKAISTIKTKFSIINELT